MSATIITSTSTTTVPAAAPAVVSAPKAANKLVTVDPRVEREIRKAYSKRPLASPQTFYECWSKELVNKNAWVPEWMLGHPISHRILSRCQRNGPKAHTIQAVDKGPFAFRCIHCGYAPPQEDMDRRIAVAAEKYRRKRGAQERNIASGQTDRDVKTYAKRALIKKAPTSSHDEDDAFILGDDS